MGQQQLLLIALSVIIVGAAVAVGVNLLTSGQTQAEVDKFYQVATQAGIEFGKWYNKPVAMGGGGKDVSLFPTDQSEAAAILGLDDAATGEGEIYLSANVALIATPFAVIGSTTATTQGVVITLTSENFTTSAAVTCALSGRGRARWDKTESNPPQQS